MVLAAKPIMVSLLLSSCLGFVSTFALAADNNEAASLAILFRQSFGNWDANRTVSSKTELDQAIQNPAIKGNQAAALGGG